MGSLSHRDTWCYLVFHTAAEAHTFAYSITCHHAPENLVLYSQKDPQSHPSILSCSPTVLHVLVTMLMYSREDTVTQCKPTISHSHTTITQPFIIIYPCIHSSNMVPLSPTKICNVTYTVFHNCKARVSYRSHTCKQFTQSQRL